MENLINFEEFEKFFTTGLNEAMTEAAEPIIQKAIQDIEKEMREVMAKSLIAMVQNNFSIERMQNDIKIIVKQALPDARGER